MGELEADRAHGQVKFVHRCGRRGDLFSGKPGGNNLHLIEVREKKKDGVEIF